ncbi:MAG: IS982 family transposase [Phycisphaera sp.]|nr:IS982 family transposase [Phycisphaera sp.]
MYRKPNGKEATVDFTATYVDVDDFWQTFRESYHQQQITDGRRHRRRAAELSVSEMMTILIAFQSSNFRTFKHFYLYLLHYHRKDFPTLVSYSRFIQWMPRVTMPLFAYLVCRCRGPVTGVSFIDSTALKVCGNKRIRRHRVFRGLAQIGKTTMGWFYGFKLHLVINDRGDPLAFTLTPGNVDDRVPVEQLARDLWGKLFADKGYISRTLCERLYQRGVKLVTNLRKNMANTLMDATEKLLLRKRSLIETVSGRGDTSTPTSVIARCLRGNLRAPPGRLRNPMTTRLAAWG